MFDVQLIAAIQNKEKYTRMVPFIKEHTLSPQAWKIVSTLKEYYDSYPSKTEVDWNEFQLFFYAVHKIKAEERVLFDLFFKNVIACDSTTVVVEDVLKNYVTKDYATRILNISADIIQDVGKHSMDDILPLMESYTKEVGTSVSRDDLFVSPDLTYVKKTVSEPGFQWRLNELNVSAGPLRRGDFVIVSARPETGKTTFGAAEVSWFASQLPDDKRPIIWVNNEEPSDKVMSRIIQSYFGVTNEDLMKAPLLYTEKYAAEIGKRILVIDDDMDMNDRAKLDGLFAEMNPSLIVFDQLDKVDGYYKETAEHMRLGKMYKWARNLAKKYGPCIAFSQASEVADSVKYITQSMLRGSKTDKAAEADLIITIGRPTEDDGTRYIHLPKNKLFGGPLSQEIHRHGYFECQIKPAIARYEGVF